MKLVVQDLRTDVRETLDVPPPRIRPRAALVVTACGGGEFAHHAGRIVVTVNLCAAVPDGATLQDACFGTRGAIALRGIRRGGLGLGGGDAHSAPNALESAQGTEFIGGAMPEFRIEDVIELNPNDTELQKDWPARGGS